MRNLDAHPTPPPVDLLTAVRAWLWRHSSQPNGDPWDGDPEHLDRTAQNLLIDLAQVLPGTTPQPARAMHPPRTPHLSVDAHGLPLDTPISAAYRQDNPLVKPVQDLMPAIKRGGRGRPRRPVKLHGDRDYDVPRVRRYLPGRGITARIAWRGDDSGQQLGRHGWGVKRILGWLSHKRLAVRYDRTAATMTAPDRLAITFICARWLPTN